jgi:CIC family chloride channel protein
VIGFFIPQVEGAGYGYVGQVLTGNFILPIVAALVILKLVATASCYASGNTGGIFGPSLFMGAMLGGAVGTVLHHWFPVHTATAGAYALVGMGCTFAGIIRTPLTSVFMIFELTRDYTIVVPLMIANMISFYISYKLQPKPIYEALNEQDGIHLPDPEAQRSRHSKKVAEVMRVAPSFVSPDTPLHDLTPHPFGGLYLVGVGDELLGVLRAADVAEALNIQDPDTQVEMLMHPGPAEADASTLDEFPHVHADQPVELALERMGTDQVSMLPVLDRANVKHVRGVVLGDDILRSYGVPLS